MGNLEVKRPIFFIQKRNPDEPIFIVDMGELDADTPHKGPFPVVAFDLAADETLIEETQRTAALLEDVITGKAGNSKETS